MRTIEIQFKSYDKAKLSLFDKSYSGSDSLTKTEARVKAAGEVYTPDWMVSKMCDYIDTDIIPDQLMIDPTCGNGNFLSEILTRKLARSSTTNERVVALATTLGMDLIEDNVQETRERLMTIAKGGIAPDILEKIVHETIRQGNLLEDDFEIVSHVYVNKNMCRITLSRHSELTLLSGGIDTIAMMNPPYQIDVNGNGMDMRTIYNTCIEKVLPMVRKAVVICPARYMFAKLNCQNGWKFRENLLSSGHLRLLDLYNNEHVIFGPDVLIKSGVSVFNYDKSYRGDTLVSVYPEDVVDLQYTADLTQYAAPHAVFCEYRPLLNVATQISGPTFDSIMSRTGPYGLSSNVLEKPHISGLKWEDLRMCSEDWTERNSCWLLALSHGQPVWAELDRDKVPVDDYIDTWRLFIPKAIGKGLMSDFRSTPVLANPGLVCSQSYVRVGSFATKEEAMFCRAYMATKFFAAMLFVNKRTQNASKDVYRSIPLVPFDRIWTDADLYEHFGVSEDDQDFIESHFTDFSEAWQTERPIGIWDGEKSKLTEK